KTQVTEKIAQEIQQVLDVDATTLDARAAIAYAQVAKAVKGDKGAYEMINEYAEKQDKEVGKGGGFVVEIRVVEDGK
ncbi:MAG: hypothetical protein RR315_07180, partial [Oscillospiraceae bacterium]